MATATGEKPKKQQQNSTKKFKASSGTYSEKIAIPREIRRTSKKIAKHKRLSRSVAGLERHFVVLTKQLENARTKRAKL